MFIHKGGELVCGVEALNGSRGAETVLAHAGRNRLAREKDSLFATGQNDRGCAQIDNGRSESTPKARGDGAFAGNSRKAGGGGDLTPGRHGQAAFGADRLVDVAMADHCRPGAVCPDHRVECRGEYEQCVAGGKALAHLIQNRNVNEGI